MARFLLPATLVFAVLTLACSQGTAPRQQPVQARTPVPSSAAAATPAPAMTESILDVSSPADESVVTKSPVDVAGKAAPDAVVTVNGQVVEVDANGRFNVQVTLEEGPNVIEVLASDFSGQK
ncbi:MAG: hypothetical protein FJ316_05195 [SAR202 cluster bacterium]|nr:hypothetical protein [SAR202 cluster bacterium]